jgi:pimeloyl-ACP methyl ester carboxylesterase
MLVALPAGFAPTPRNYPILIVSATTNGDASSVDSAKANYLPDATEKGFVVIAVDGENGKPAGQGGDNVNFRWALVQAGLAALYKEWPNAKKWPIATAGISGGGGYASHQAMLLLDKQYPLIGLLLSVTGWTPGDFPDVTRRAPRAAVRTLPVFFTAGEKDEIATPEKTEKAHRELATSGFKNVRYEKFDGGHRLHRPHLQQALEWFVAEYKKSAGGASVL